MNRCCTLTYLFLTAVLTVSATAATSVVTTPTNSKPESVTVAPSGAIITSSMAAPVVYRAAPNASAANIFIDMRPDNAAFTLGVLADKDTETLWVCEILKANWSNPFLKGQSVLRAFDLRSGKPKGQYPLPGTNNWCNDVTLGPDHSLYVADTVGGRILRLHQGEKTLETVLQDPTLYGVDGITYLNGALYVNTVWSDNIYRLSLGSSDKLGKPVQIALSRLLKGPDGMRAAHGRLFVAENAGHKVDAITISGDKGYVTTVKDGLVQPTGIEPSGNTLWISDRGASKIYSIPIPMSK